jgi:hypothetical protein
MGHAVCTEPRCLYKGALYFHTSTLVAQFILTPATKLKNKNYTSLHYNDNNDTITVMDPTPETSRILNINIIINIQGWAIWPVPSPELQLLSPSLLRSPNCSLSLWAVVE